MTEILDGKGMNCDKEPSAGNVTIVFLGVVIMLFVAACNSASPKDEAFAVIFSDGQANPGQAVFEGNCIRCHPYGKRGVGPNLSKKELTVEQVRKQVRKGGLIMPSFSEEKINDEELGQVAEFVVSLKERIGER
jgi:mono/diheme cytochrome c family protein